MSDTTKNGTLVTGAVQLGYTDNDAVTLKFNQASNANRAVGVTVEQFGATKARIDSNGIAVYEDLKVKDKVSGELKKVATEADIQSVELKVEENAKEDARLFNEMAGRVNGVSESVKDAFVALNKEENARIEGDKALAEEIAALKSAGEGLVARVDEVAGMTDAAKQEMAELSKTFGEKIAAADAAIAKADEAAQAAATAVEDAKAEVKEDVVALDKKIEDKAHELNELIRDARAEHEADKNALKIEVAEIKAACDTHKTESGVRFSKIEARVEQNTDDIRDLEGEVAACKIACGASKESFDKTILEMGDNINAVYGEIKELDKKFADCDKVAADLSKLTAAHAADIEAVRNQVYANTSKVNANADALDKYVANQTKDMVAVQKAIEELRQADATEVADRVSADTKLGDKIVDLNNRVGDVEAAVESAKGAVERISAATSATVAQVQSHLNEFAGIKQSVKDLGAQQDVEKEELVELSDKFGALKSDVKKEFEKQTEVFDGLSTRIQQNENDITKIRTALGESGSQIGDLADQTESLAKKLEGFDKRISDNTKAIDEVQDDLYHLKSSVTEQLAQSIGLTTTVNDNLTKFDSRIKTVERIVEEAKQAGDNVVAVVAKVDDLGKAVEEHVAELNARIDSSLEYDKEQDARIDALEAGNADQSKQIADLQNASVNLLAHLTECGKANIANAEKNAEQDARLAALEGADGEFGETLKDKFAVLEQKDADQQAVIDELVAASEGIAKNAEEIARVNGELVNTNTVLGQVAENLSGVNAALVKEIEDRKAADAAFDERMDKYADNVLSIQREIHDAFGKIEAEQVAREESDKALSDAIAAEKAARQETDAALNQTIVDSVNNINEMVAGQVSTLVTAIQTNAGAINQEIADRKAADSSIRTDVNAAIEQVAAGLQSQINTLHMVGDPAALQDLAKTVEAINANKELIENNAGLIADNKAAIEKNASDIAALAEKHDAEVATINGRLDALEAKDVELEAKDAAIESAVKTIQSNNVKRDERIKKLEEEMAKVDSNVITDIKVRLAVAETKIDSVVAESKECMTSCASFKNEVIAHMGEYERVADDLKTTTDEHIAKAEDRLDNHGERIAVLEALLGNQSLIEDLTNAVAAFDEKMKAADELNAEQTALIEEQKAINEEQAKTIEEQAEQIAEQKEINEAQAKKIDKMAATMYALLAGLKDLGMDIDAIEIPEVKPAEFVEDEEGGFETNQAFDEISLS